MPSFTKQEKIVLTVLAFVIFLGSTLHYTFKKFPQIKDIVNFIDSNRAYPKVDLNTASFEDLVRIPYIGEYTANNIIAYRQELGAFDSLTQLKAVKGIREKNFKKFTPFLTIK